MFSIFKKKKPATDAFAFLGADMHNHLLPGIDDGSPDEAESMYLLEGMQQLGFSRFYCTPHVIAGVHPNTPSTITAAASQLRNALDINNNNVEMGFSAEYMMSFEMAELIDADEIIPLPQNHVLVEMSYALESPNWREIIFTLQTKGFQPILAHPERYNFWQGNLHKMESVMDAGGELQVNLLSLEGYYGRPVQKMAEKLMDAGFISWAGSDLHHRRHLEGLQNLARNKKAMRLLEKANLKNHALGVTH